MQRLKSTRYFTRTVVAKEFEAVQHECETAEVKETIQ